MDIYQSVYSDSCIGVSVERNGEAITRCSLYADCVYAVPSETHDVYGNATNIESKVHEIISVFFFTARPNAPGITPFFFVDSCPAPTSSDVIAEPPVDCLVYPTFLCNGVRNCDNCEDENESVCSATKPCTGGA